MVRLSSEVSELSLDFEALAHANRMAVSWAGDVTAPHQRLVVDDGGGTHEVVASATALASFIERLVARLFPEEAAPDTTDLPDATDPSLEVPPTLLDRHSIGGVRPDAPTAPSREISPLQFFRCTAVFTVSGTRRRVVVNGEPAMDVYVLADDFLRRLEKAR